MWKLSDILFHKKAKLTNTLFPHSDYVNHDSYPEQEAHLIGEIVELKFYSEYRCNIAKALGKAAVKIIDGEKVSLRPQDDVQFMEDRTITGPDEVDAKDYWTKECLVLRADKGEPYVFIAVTTDYSEILVSNTKINELHHYDFLDKVTCYPLQDNNYYNINLQTHYMDDKFINDEYYDAIALRVDRTEPCLSVIMEYIDDNTVRFILADETYIIDNDEIDESRYIKDSDIPDYRRRLLEGKTIWNY